MGLSCTPTHPYPKISANKHHLKIIFSLFMASNSEAVVITIP